MTETIHTLQEFWHSCLIALPSGAIIAGLGYYFDLRLGHVFFSHAGALIGSLGGTVFCAFVIIRLRKRTRDAHTNAQDRTNARLSFPRFVLGLVRYGIVTGGATLLGLMSWIIAEDYALERPLDGPIEIILGCLISLSIGLTTFHVLLRAFENE
jgi:hypothetical protein